MLVARGIFYLRLFFEMGVVALGHLGARVAAPSLTPRACPPTSHLLRPPTPVETASAFPRLTLKRDSRKMRREMQHSIVTEPSELTHFRKHLSSTRHQVPWKWAKPCSSVKHTPRENSKQSTFCIDNSIMSTSLQYLVHFIQYRVSDILYYNTKVQSAIIKQRNKNKHLAVRYKDPFVPTRRILHTRTSFSWCTCNKGK
jgi:hypothetical protein